MGQPAKALPWYEQARAAFAAAGDTADVGRACNNLGTCHFNMGQYAMAIPWCEQARAAYTAAGDAAPGPVQPSASDEAHGRRVHATTAALAAAAGTECPLHCIQYDGMCRGRRVLSVNTASLILNDNVLNDNVEYQRCGSHAIRNAPVTAVVSDVEPARRAVQGLIFCLENRRTLYKVSCR
eukprot:Tamp_35465.p1 GENE.Tamp_35465~~Tamp_35465.p1  ORF type:complete len:181 (-),score=18.01 Tamp_35465:33-575(-)